MDEQERVEDGVFQIGDIVKAKEDAPYSITRGTAVMRVEQIWGEAIKVKIIRYSDYVGESYEVSSKYFYKIKGIPQERSWVIKDREGKMVKEDWVVRNWDFLSARKIISIPMSRARNILRQDQVLTTGKFYGTEEFINQLDSYCSIRYNGTKTLFLRPYISAPMPKGILAVYADPKRYKFGEDGLITGLSSTFEFPVYVFRE